MNFVIHYVRLIACLFLTPALLAACSFMKDVRCASTTLDPIKTAHEVSETWKVHIGKSSNYSFVPAPVGDYVYAASADGSVLKIDATNGRKVWNTKIGTDLSAGVGSDGTVTAVCTLKGNVLALDDNGKILWKSNVLGEIITPPAVRQDFVLVRTISGSITAFNSQTGEQKWVYVNHAAPLNLRTIAGITFSGKNTLLAGFPGGVLAAINLQSGNAYWQTSVSYPHGVTEVERINDVTGSPTVVGSQTCAVTRRGQIGCFDILSGRALWKQPFSSYSGLAQDDHVVASTNEKSGISLYDSKTGEYLWQNVQLERRAVTAPTIAGNVVVVGDCNGFIHFLSCDTGEFIARKKTSKAIITQPIVAGNTLVVQTCNGDLYGFRPQ
ncbi:outer membrane protein assembly factor BamB [Candidatus Vallotia tarda]|uniref:Outer membrane protein assembly factor BamB n=1 Tax=Candidatus Vallotiella hemipterorum TaxID=1177213 RepID=A0A916JW72_9BURK|nr:outer membrane protein assembly factor BamB [Candidatus Vallotia tarda]CAG7602773.1 Outer membrane protein assembly factor BamB [Candidatus Vallotia tarda]